MHAIAKRALALAAATSGLVLGCAMVGAAEAAAAAQPPTPGGAASGWIQQAPVNIPVKLCGETMQATAIREMAEGSGCVAAAAQTARSQAAGHSYGDEPGAPAPVAWGPPALFCGWNTTPATPGAGERVHDDSTCTD